MPSNSPSNSPTNWTDHFAALKALEPDTLKALNGAAQTVTVPAGQVVFRGGDECQNYLLVLEGVVRVQMTSESGREIVLYRVDAGETCVLTTACLLAHEAYSAEGVTETEVKAIMIPATAFHRELGRSEALRTFVFSTYGARITDLMILVEEVAFGRLDERLARFLCDHADPQGGLTTTHQDLAHELGTAREVISRQLKDFERHGWVRLSRGRIEVADTQALQSLAQG